MVVYKCVECGTTETFKWYKDKTQCGTCYQRHWNSCKYGNSTCRVCGKTKSAKWYRGGKVCNLCYKRIITYGLTEDQVANLPTSCEICGSTSRLCVDHCHDSEDVRGILCTSCNCLLGGLGDTIENVSKWYKACIEYLSLGG